MAENKPKIVQITGLSDNARASLAALDSDGNIFVYMRSAREWKLLSCPLQENEETLARGGDSERYNGE